MRKFWGFYENGTYSVGCNGATVYIYDCHGKELKKFKDFPYAYKAAFMPGKNIIAVKSTSGYLGFYDLDQLTLVKRYTVTTIGAQDEGFSFSPDGKYFYNIEKPVTSTATQLSIYETSDFKKIHSLFADNETMVLDYLETDDETSQLYVAGFMRDSEGIFDYGFVAIYDTNNFEIVDIRIPDKEVYEYLRAYKRWELDGFTQKSLEWNYTLKPLEKIKPISIKEVHDKL